MDKDLSEFFIVGFTGPGEFGSPEEEAEIIQQYLESGAIDLFHIRKPDAPSSYVLSLIELIPEVLHGRLVIHSHYNSLMNVCSGGIHLKLEVPELYVRNCMSDNSIISIGSHSLEELQKKMKPYYSYCFLSPVFDSISKKGYLSNFNLDDKDLADTIENYKVVALGGVRPEFFQKLYDTKFAGAALLGYLWSPETGLTDKINVLLESRKKLIKH